MQRCCHRTSKLRTWLQHAEHACISVSLSHLEIPRKKTCSVNVAHTTLYMPPYNPLYTARTPPPGIALSSLPMHHVCPFPSALHHQLLHFGM